MQNQYEKIKRKALVPGGLSSNVESFANDQGGPMEDLAHSNPSRARLGTATGTASFGVSIDQVMGGMEANRVLPALLLGGNGIDQKPPSAPEDPTSYSGERLCGAVRDLKLAEPPTSTCWTNAASIPTHKSSFYYYIWRAFTTLYDCDRCD